MKSFKEQLEVDIGWTAVDLEARDDYTRSQETNFTNLVADLMRTEYGTDFAIINSGSFRLNQLVPAGPINLKVLQGMFPFPDTMCVLRMPGFVFKEVLEEAVSLVPELDGRFPAISGLKFSYDPSKPKYDRIAPTDIDPAEHEILHMNEMYSVAVPSYIGKGGDGFSMFAKPEVETVVDPENSMWLIDVVKQFFKRTSKDYEVNPRRELARQKRLRLCNTDSEEPENVSSDGQWIMIRPAVDGRIHKIGE